MSDEHSPNTTGTDDSLANPAWVVYINPFCFIVPDHEKAWEVSLDEINNHTYDHGKLSRIITKLPTPLGEEWPMLVCYDGGLAIPRALRFSQKEDAIEFFNTTLCNLFLGGMLCEAIDTRDVVWGKLHRKKHIWPVDYGDSVSSQLHAGLRTKFAGPLQTIALSSPATIPLSKFREAFSIGSALTSKLPAFSPKFFIIGVSELRNRNWSSSLSNLWISIEQLTDYLWKCKFLADASYHPTHEISKRVSSLRQDNRTWSSSVKQEILYQNGIIAAETLELIFPARQARNSLVHDGKGVSKEQALAACKGTIGLLSHCTDEYVRLDESLFSPQEDVLRRGKRITREVSFNDWKSLGTL
jgi:hypothetical protein